MDEPDPVRFDEFEDDEVPMFFTVCLKLLYLLYITNEIFDMLEFARVATETVKT